MCAIFFENPEAQRRRRGGPVTLDLRTWDFNNADCRSKCRNLVDNSESLPLMDHQSTLMEVTRSKHGRFCIWHSFVSCTKYSYAEDGTFFTHSHNADGWNQATIVNFMNRCSRRYGTAINSERLGFGGSRDNQNRCNCCDLDGPSTRIGKKFDTKLLEICGFSITFVRGKFESPKCEDWRIGVMHKVLWARTIAAPYESV